MWLIPQDVIKPINARSARFQPKTPAAAKPFLKWAGGKAQVLDSIRMKYPVGLGRTVMKYAEPFVGGDAVLFDILSNYQLSEVYISDINRELVLTYNTIRDNISILTNHLKRLEDSYLPADEFYYLYSNHKIFRICASRAINSNGNGRGKINELLIASY